MLELVTVELNCACSACTGNDPKIRGVPECAPLGPGHSRARPSSCGAFQGTPRLIQGVLKCPGSFGAGNARNMRVTHWGSGSAKAHEQSPGGGGGAKHFFLLVTMEL